MSHQLLLVEADPDDAAILSAVLRDRGYRVDVAVSASEVGTKEDVYSVALIDLWLPDGSGIELAHTMRGRQPDLDFIFLTGQSTLQSGIGAVAFGSARYIQKPCHPGRLLQVVDSVIDKRSLRDEAARQARRVQAVNDLLSLLVQTLDIEQIAQDALTLFLRVSGATGIAMVIEPRQIEGVTGHVFDAGHSSTELIVSLESNHWLEVLGPPATLSATPDGRWAFMPMMSSDGALLGTLIFEGLKLPVDHQLLGLMSRQFGNGLEQAALHRKLELAYEHLRETHQTMLEAEKQSAVGRVAAGVAHEIGTPLSIIGGRAEVLLSKEPEQTEARSLVIIREQTERIASLVRQLLDYSRAEVDTDRTRVSLSGVVSETLPLLQTRLLESDCRVIESIPHELPSVVASFHQLQQVLMNLVLNAFDAGAQTVTLSGRQDDPDEVTLTVVDDGSGIAPERLATVFEPFYTTKGRGQGTGLGLAVVRQIIRDHNGQVRAFNNDGPGARFEVTLPC